MGAAADLERLSVTRDGDLFGLDMVARVGAPRAAVWAALTDYSRLCRFSREVTRSDVLGREPDGRPLVHTRNRICVWIFCRELGVVQLMAEHGPARLDAETVSELSDFAYGVAQWDLRDAGARTRVELSARLRPGFWVPPIIGPYLVRQGLLATAREALEGLERVALSGL